MTEIKKKSGNEPERIVIFRQGPLFSLERRKFQKDREKRERRKRERSIVCSSSISERGGRAHDGEGCGERPEEGERYTEGLLVGEVTISAMGMGVRPGNCAERRE